MRLIEKSLIILLFLISPTLARAQVNFLKTTISIELANVEIEDALIEISDKGGFNFSYNANMINSDSSISLLLNNVTVKEALDRIFDGRADYTVSGSHLIIQTKKRYIQPVPKQEYSITGYVYNRLTGEKIPDVSIYDVNTLEAAITNDNGYFNITVSSERNYLGLAVAKEDFQDTVLIVEPKDNSLNIYMKPKVEVVYKPLGVKTESEPPKIEELKIVQKLVKEDQRKQARNINIFKTTPIQVSLIPSVSFNNLNSSVENHFSLNILGGYSKGLKGVELGGWFNILRENMRGVQVAGLANLVGGSVNGVQISGIYNHAMDTTRGLQASGIVNINYETLTGVQLAGIVNHVHQDVQGWQLSGIGNSAWGSVDGLQIGGIYNFSRHDVNLFQVAGIVNHSRNTNGFQVAGIANSTNDVSGFQIGGIVNQGRTVDGFQIGGIANVARDSVGGFQIAGISNYAHELGGYQMSGIINVGRKAPKGQFAGIVNVATDELKGVQFAGVINYANKVEGVQFGVINISDTISETPFGLLSFVRKGYHSMELSFTEVMTTNLTFRTGVRRFYNIFTGGARLQDFQNFKLAGYGIGTTFNPTGKTAFTLEGIHHLLFEKSGEDNGISHLSQLAFRFHFLNRKKLSIVAGPTFNVLVSDWKDPDSNAFISDVGPYALFTNESRKNMLKGWVGFSVGVEY